MTYMYNKNIMTKNKTGIYMDVYDDEVRRPKSTKKKELEEDKESSIFDEISENCNLFISNDTDFIEFSSLSFSILFFYIFVQGLY